MMNILSCEGWSWCRDGLDAYSTIRISLTVAALAIVYYAWRAKVATKSNKTGLPPGPSGLPIIGNLPFMRPDLHRYFEDLSKIYGPIFKFPLPRKVFIIVSSPEIAKEVLKEQDATFANRDGPVAALFGTFGGANILFRPNGPEYGRIRGLIVREIMSSKSLDACYSLRRREIRKMVKLIHGKAGSSINLGEQIFLTTLNIMLSVLWSESLDGEEGSKLGVQVRRRLGDFLGLMGAANISDLFPILAPLDLQGIQGKAKEHIFWFYTMFEAIIARRKETAGEGKEKEETSKDFLHTMLELNQRGELTINEVKALLLDMMLGGADTMPTTAEWALTELMRNPDKMRRVTEELDAVVGKENIVEESHLPHLPYLEAVVNETLRLYPVVPLLLSRVPSKNCTVAGYTIPKGSVTFVNSWAIHRDPKLWENPHEFVPERFFTEGVNSRGNTPTYTWNNFQFFPFGSGRRICIGIPLAEKMVAHMLAMLIHSFEWKLPDGIKPNREDNLRVILAKKDPLFAIPVPRLPSALQYQ